MMSSSSRFTLDEALNAASAQAADLDPTPFTPSALHRLEQTINGFIADLVDEAYRMARRHRSEVVSAQYVDTAATYLVASASKRIYRHLGTIGGILVGGSLSNILAMVQTGQALPILGALVSLGLGLVGTFLVALHIAKD